MKQSELLMLRMDRVARRGLSLPEGSWGRTFCTRLYDALWRRWQVVQHEERGAA